LTGVGGFVNDKRQAHQERIRAEFGFADPQGIPLLANKPMKGFDWHSMFICPEGHNSLIGDRWCSQIIPFLKNDT
jgi:hypothetical protein